MRTKTKVVGWCAITAVALMMWAGCVMFKSDEERNEVVYEFDYADYPFGFHLTCIEQTDASTDNALKTSDVCIISGVFLQAYRIEGCSITNYRWSDYIRRGFSEFESVGGNKFESFLEQMYIMHQTHKQLPNKLRQDETYLQPLENDSTVEVTVMTNGREPLITPFVSQEAIYWDNWTTWQWAGVSNEVPAEIETFRHSIAQIVAAPKYARNCRSYLRAVPLFSKAELAAEKDTLLIDLSQTLYHAQRAVRYPYLLIPIPEKKSPFPTVQKYTPGDKFRVRQKYKDEEYYYLIETFKRK
jgi:hypothetical protein